MIKMETLDRGRILTEMNLKAENMRSQDDPFYSFYVKNRREKSGIREDSNLVPKELMKNFDANYYPKKVVEI